MLHALGQQQQQQQQQHEAKLFCAHYHLLPKVTKLEEVVPGLLHPVRPPVPQAVWLTQQNGVVAARPCSLPGRHVLQSLNLCHNMYDHVQHGKRTELCFSGMCVQDARALLPCVYFLVSIVCLRASLKEGVHVKKIFGRADIKLQLQSGKCFERRRNK